MENKLKVERSSDEKKGLIKKTLERCKSFAVGGKGKKTTTTTTTTSSSSSVDDDQTLHGFIKRKSKSWSSLCVRDGKQLSSSSSKKSKVVVAPEGCFSVYVGPLKQRFVIKTEYVNHPLFKMLLEEAESEYGYNCEGPLTLPCHVDYFLKLLSEMEDFYELNNYHHHRHGCAGFPRSPNSYRLLMPSSTFIAINQV